MTKDSDQTSLQQDFLANHSASQEKENQRKMTEISGKKLLELSKSPDQLGLLEKMLVESLNSISTPYLRTWRVQTTPRGALIFQLRASVQNTKGKESGLLRTPTTGDARIGINNIKGNQHRMKRGSTQLADQILFPTPTAGNSMNVVMPPEFVKRNSSGWTVTRKGTGTKFGAKLNDVVNYLEKTKTGGRQIGLPGQVYLTMYGTPKAQDSRAALTDRGKSNLGEQVHGMNNAKKTGGRLSPNFVEFLMGFPTNWTKIESTESKDSETQSFHKSHTTSDKS